MHSMPSVALHPDTQHFACQSLDNQIIVYTARDRFRINNRKRFTGHHTAGYACQVAFSADGQFVCSGDANGRVFFWPWEGGRRTVFKAHDDVCIGVQWAPTEGERVGG